MKGRAGIKVAVISLGCAKNQVESEYILGILKEHGFEIVTDDARARVIIVNTCSFIRIAKEEALETVMAVASRETKPYIIVTGCLSQQHGRELFDEMPEAAAIIGPEATGRLPEIIAKVTRGERVLDLDDHKRGGNLPRHVFEQKPYAYLKIAEGCNNTCSYCTIPAIKGPYRSRSMEEITAEAEKLVQSGIPELVLVAQDTTAYGMDIYGAYRLPDLLRRLARIPEVRWLRVLYAYPTRVTEKLIEAMAVEDKVLPYLDLPLQHASAAILKQMARGSGFTTGVEVIHRLRDAMPEIALRSTFIVGFPGEREEDFQELLDFLRSMQFDWVGAFEYSPEEGTPAAELPRQVPEEVKSERYHRLMLQQQAITRARNERWMGRRLEVLVEKPGTGRSYRQAPEVDGVIYLEGGTGRPGEMITAEITGVHRHYDLIGRTIE